MVNQTLRYGDSSIPYRVAFVPGRQREIAIHLMPDGSVRVESPAGASLQEVKKAVSKRAGWLTKHLRDFRSRNAHVLPREYVSGESHFYLGRRYPLKVNRSGSDAPSVKLRQGRLEITTGQTEPIIIRGMLWDWYKARAREVFERRMAQRVPDLTWIRTRPAWKLLSMKRQWGSCSPGGTLSLNPHLVKAPVSCIDYVLLHELCHLKYHDHSPRFYRLLGKQMPGWEAVKARLDGMAELMLNI